MRARPEAVRRALIAHLGLAARERRSFAQTVAALGAVQMDPMRIVAPAHLLTLRLRRGPTSEVAFSRTLASGAVFEARLKERCIVAAQDLPAAVPQFARARAEGLLVKRGLEGIAAEIITEISRGARYSRELGTEHRVASFWDENPASMKATTMALDILAYEGRVIVCGRRRGERRYDLPERLFPAWERTIGDRTDARIAAALHYGRTMGVFLATDPYLGWSMEDASARRALAQELCASGEWEELHIDGVERPYLCTRDVAQLLADPSPVRGVQILAPLDNLLWDRRRLRDLFDFDYKWEAYTPAAQRQVGPYGMPVLLDGRLVAELDARRDQEGVLRFRIAARTRLRAAEDRRIAHAAERLASDLGTTALAQQVPAAVR
ncbi:MAG: winged helix DNA-binding domain-containing protein [Thermaerobacter sp.]|nr:winged helix DNA-binding domain-containing protein [Thermaerobacter sp.]